MSATDLVKYSFKPTLAVLYSYIVLHGLQLWWTLTGEVAATANANDACVVDVSTGQQASNLCLASPAFAYVLWLYQYDCHIFAHKSRYLWANLTVRVSMETFLRHVPDIQTEFRSNRDERGRYGGTDCVIIKNAAGCKVDGGLGCQGDLARLV